MRYTILGGSGLRVSEVCLGTMTFGEDWGWGASRETSRAIFDTFVDAGGNFIDTANNYTNGSSEKLVGEFIASDRDAFVVATKFTLRRPGTAPSDLNAGGNHRKNLQRSVERSLVQLGTDHLDLLYLHVWDYSTPIDEVVRALDDLVRAGKVLHVGLSDTPAWVAARGQTIAELRGWSRFVAFQGQYNLLTRGIERDVLPMTRELGMGVLAFSLLASGVLTGKFNRGEGPGEGTRTKQIDPAQRAAAEVVIEVAERLGRTPSQVAIRWVQQQSPNIIPLLGARRVEQLVDNLGALEFTLDDDDLATLTAIRPLPRDYPHSFWNDFVRRELVYGERVDALDAPSWPH